MKPIAQLLRNEGYKALVCESSTEKGSILPLKLAAVRAGFGWQGKHSLLISKKYGSFLALGGIITNADLPPNTVTVPDNCKNCLKCRQNCTSDALSKAYQLNVEKCLSYLLQIEDFPEKLKTATGNRVGDCEICQETCPWNSSHMENPLSTKITIHFRNKIKDLAPLFPLSKLMNMSQKDD